MYKCVVIIRNDLKISKGKVIAQTSHGIVNMILNCNKNKISNWRDNGEKIVSVKVNDITTMLKVIEISERKGVYNYMVVDAGHTEVQPNTPTVCIIGPDTDTKIEKLTGQLKLY